MFKRTSALALTLTVGFAASRLGAPSAAAPSAIVPPGIHAFTGHPTPAKVYAGGCTAYMLDRPSAKHEAAEDENKGVATKVLNKFFGLEDVTKAALPANVRYAIALAPDPKHTNLSLLFDREMSLLVQAAQDQGYDYNSSWLPWQDDESQGLTHLGNRQYASELAEAREACPGIVLFRKRLLPPQTQPAPAGQPSATEPARDAYDQALVVFVVGEQATGGINVTQWKNAKQWLTDNRLGPDGKHGDGILRVLGPTFTGSLVSLSREIADTYPGDTSFTAKFPNARIFSGTVTGCPAIHWFQSQLPQTATNHVYFGTFQENDSVHTYRFLQYLSSQGTDANDTAILSEDETAYAVTPSSVQTPLDQCDFNYPPDKRPLHLVYPRDISALRNAYEKQSVFGPSSAGLKDRQHPILHEEAPSDGSQSGITDTIPSSNGSVAAVEQEAYLYGLVSFLRTHHTRYLILRSTNPLDFLFLTRFFHRAYPEARIVTVGSDLLFRREIDTTEFRGVLSLSSYPLLPRAQHWSNVTEEDWEKQPHNHLVFQSHLAEGTYIAARYVLLDEKLKKDDLIVGGGRADGPLKLNRAIPTPDYADPFWFHLDPTDKSKPSGPSAFDDHPPTWLAAVGRDGYWPIAVIGEDTSKALPCLAATDDPCKSKDAKATESPLGDPPHSTMVKLQPPPTQPCNEKSSPGQHYEQKPPANDQAPKEFSHGLLIGLPLPWLVCDLLAFALICYQIWGIRRGKPNPQDGLFSVFRTTADAPQALLLGISCALAITLLGELGGPGFLPPYAVLSFSAAVKVGIVTLILVTATIWTGILLASPATNQSGKRALAWVSLVAPLIAFFLMYRCAFATGPHDAGTVPLLYRMVHITDGVSPLVPILLLTFGFYLWNWQAMAGNLIVAAGCPTLPGAGNEPGKTWSSLQGVYNKFIGYELPPTPADGNLLGPSDERISHKLGREILKIAHPLCFSLRIIAAPLFLLLSAVVCFVLPPNLPLLSMESRNFNIVVNSILLIALLITATEALRLYSTWVNLRKLLQALARLRLRRTISRLRPIQASSIWSVSGNVRRVQYDLFAEQLDAAKRLLKFRPYDSRPLQPWFWLADVVDYGEEFVRSVESSSTTASWEMPVTVKSTDKLIRDVLSDATAEVYNKVLVDAWNKETQSLNLECSPAKTGETKSEEGSAEKRSDGDRLPLSTDPKVRVAEEFVAYHYIAFIQNIVARMRTMTLSMIFLFIAVCFAISFYPFVPRTEIGVWLVLNLALIGAAVAYVYAGMERDEVMSYIVDTPPGRLGAEFWVKLAAFLAGPVIGILTTQFPSITDTVLQWLQPGLDAIK